MRIRTTRALALAAAVAAASAGLITTSGSSASALAAGTPPAGAVTMSPTSGTGATSGIVINPPSGSVCPGDTASGGYRWSTFFVSRSVDPATLTYGAGGPVSPGGSVFVQPLTDNTGSPVVAKTTGVTSGLITPIPTYSFGFYPAGFVPAGQYWIGYACYGGAQGPGNSTARYWSTGLTVTANPAGGASQLSFTQGFAPDAPVLASPLTSSDGSLAGTFTLSTANAAVTTLVATATPTVGAPVTVNLATNATSFNFTGLTNGTQYSVQVTATNSVGSTSSNTVTGTPNPTPFPAISNFAAVGGAQKVDLSWTAPVDSQPRTGYRLEIATDGAFASPIAGSPVSVGAAAVSYSATGLTAGQIYYFRITPQYAAPYSGTASAIVSATALANAIIVQDITVVRPAGALVLTQRCGVYGALDAEAASAAFPVALPAAAAVASTGAASEAPTLDGGAVDPLFADYPYPLPANYPTHCGVDMGTGRLVTSGALAGNYYTASGRLNQITIVNTQDTDNGWTLNGSMGTFTVAGGGASFSGAFLGWTPKVSSVSSAVTGATNYTMQVNAGAAVDPNAPGLASSTALAASPANHGLGITTLDARLKLLIPSTVRAGTYSGVLTFSVI